MNNNWIFAHKTYNKEKRASIEPVFTLGNGYMCCRGFFDEEQSGILSLWNLWQVFSDLRAILHGKERDGTCQHTKLLQYKKYLPTMRR